MIRFLIASSFCIIIGFSTQAQEIKPSITIQEITVEDNERAARSIKGKLAKRFKKDYAVVDQGFLKLTAFISIGDMKVINGMDSYTTAEATVDYALSGPGLSAEKLNLTVRCKGKNERDLLSKIGTGIIRDKKHMTALLTFMNDYLKKHLSNCSQITQQINSLLAANDITAAYDMQGYYTWLGNCEDEKLTAEKAIEEKHINYACEQIIQKSTILANSTEQEDLNKAIDILQMVPPDAPCAEEAIKVSEKVAENGAKLSSYAAKKLEDRIVLINSVSHSDWRSWYRKNYRSIYR